MNKKKAIEFIKDMHRLKKEHYAILDKTHYSGFMAEATITHQDPYFFVYKGVEYECHHEASDPDGAVKAIMQLFELKEEDITNE